MASSQQTVDFIVEQMAPAGDIRSRKMFGEYAIYCDDKVIALVCDDLLFVKITDPGSSVVRDTFTGSPYPGAKPYYQIPEDRFEDAGYLAELARVTADALPAPKPKKPKPAR